MTAFYIVDGNLVIFSITDFPYRVSHGKVIFFRFDLEDFKYNQVNMTAFRIVDGDNTQVKQILREMELLPEIGYRILNRSQLILTQPALMYDSVYAFAKGLQKNIEEGPELKLS